MQKGTEAIVVGTTQRNGKTYRLVKIPDPAATALTFLIDDEGAFEGSAINAFNGALMGWSYRPDPPSVRLVAPTDEHPLASGTPLNQDDAQEQAHTAMEGLLKDPYSAHWTCHEPKWGTLGSGKAWGGQDLTGWILPCTINSKNSYGAYAGATLYAFLFVDQKLRRAAEIQGSGILGTQRVVYDN
jgi:hypothetical protein